MLRILGSMVVGAASLTLLMPTPAFGDSVELRQKDGRTWRGEVSENIEITFKQQGVEVKMNGQLTKVADLYIVVRGEVAGRMSDKTIFKSDIVSISSSGAGPAADAKPTGAGAADSKTPAATGTESVPSTTKSVRRGADAYDDKTPGVFILPLSGMVGEGFRHEEMEAVAKEADKYGPGQIIILDIDSGGGLALEMEQIHASLREIKKRHRLVAWIQTAISAAAATASNCDEIYFRTTGRLGAMTMFAGGVSAQGEELEKWLRSAGDWMASGGRSPYIAHAMIDEKALLSYDKDPVTGKVTWHNDLSGATILSDEKTNLVFTVSTAIDSKFADGVADTEEQLAKRLNLPKWHEKSDYGRRLAADWQATVEKAKEEIPLIFARFNYKGTATGDPKVIIGSRIQLVKQLLGWWDRCPNVCFLNGVPPKEELQRMEEEMRRTLADINKRR